ncbi:MAG: hypothetical protein ACOCP8_07350, partial [archaeon]
KEPEKTMYKKEDHTSLHIHHRISWNGIDYLTKEDCIKIINSNFYHNGFKIEPPVYNFLINVAHVFENYSISESELTHLFHLYKKNNLDVKMMVSKSKKNGWSYMFFLILNTLEKKYKTELKIDIKSHKEYLISKKNNSLKRKLNIENLYNAFKEKLNHEKKKNRKNHTIRIILIFLIVKMKNKIKKYVKIPKFSLNRKKWQR